MESSDRHGLAARALYAAVGLLSAAGLICQIGLMRVFSIAQWHHAAYMIISIALLGFGASGTVLSIVRPRLAGREAGAFRWCAAGAAIAFAASYAISQRVPFETIELLNQPRQFWLLLALYLLLAVPFFLVACCITIAFLLRPEAIGRVYGVNMAGSGAGALGCVALLYVLPPASLPVIAGGLAAIAWMLLGPPRGRRGWILPLAIVAPALVWGALTPVRVSQYKGLAYALQLPDARIETRARSPLSEITAVSSAYLRETPGQLSNYPMSELGDLPPQIGLYFDAGPVSPVHRFDGDLAPFAYLDYVTGALPYRLVSRPRCLIVGPGGGGEVLGALAAGAAHVTAVETDPAVRDLLRGPLRDFSGAWIEHPDVTFVVAEGRGHLEATRDRFDLIVLPAAGSAASAAGGVLALNETYLYTTEALAGYLDRLAPGGVLALNVWIQTPPRQGIKLFATAVEACERAGFADPGRHMAFIRSWNTGTIVISREPMGAERLAAVEQFCADRFFDPCYYPGMPPEAANRYTQLDEPYYYNAAQAILHGEREAFYRDYAYYVRPATDDRPYFFRFLRPARLAELMAQGPEAVPFVEWGYLALVATTLQSLLAGVVLILLPLLFLRRQTEGVAGRWAVFAYFASLGLAYMFLEIAFIQVFMRFLSYPIYAVSTVLAAFLVCSGAGSLWAGSLSPARRIRAVWCAVALIAALSVTYLIALPPLFHAAAGWPDVAKIPLCLILLAPLAAAMGVPFPAGLQGVATRAPAMLPWAWATNGCLSVTGATLATLVAIHAGFRSVVVLALLLYLAAAASLRMLPGARA